MKLIIELDESLYNGLSDCRELKNGKDKGCTKCAKEHEQLAAWLTELQERRETDRWIPVSERLPEESLNSVIGWDAYRERCVFVQYIDGHFQITGSDESFNIVAWKPLPKPYESEAENLDYQRAVEDTEYCERHEPTYNPDDGSM